MIRRFTSGPYSAVNNLNEIVNTVNSLNNFIGDGLINVNRTSSGYTLSLNVDNLKNRLSIGTGSGGGSSDSFTEYTIIEAPIFPTAGDPTGQAYYRIRPDSSSYSDWESDYPGGASTGYALGDFVTDSSTNFLYESLVNDNTAALTDDESWELQEETKVNYIWGYGTESIFNFAPVIPVDASIWCFEDGSETYILGNFLFVGNSDTRTISMVMDDNDDYVTAAVFA